MSIRLLRRDLLRLHVLLELARQEVHENDAVAGRPGGGRVRLRLPRVEVRVVHHHEVDSLGERFLESRQVTAMVFAEHGYVEHIASVAHEVFIGGMDGDGQTRGGYGCKEVLRKSCLARSRDGAVYEDGFHSLGLSGVQMADRILSPASDAGRLNSIGDTLTTFSNSKLYIDDTAGITVNEMKAKVRRLGDVSLVIIDYLQLISSSRKTINRVQEISDITRQLKIMAKELNIPVICLSQLSRASEQRLDHRPLLSDLRDSGSIEQDADIVIMLYREGYYKPTDDRIDPNECECIISKNRHGETRTISLYWQPEYTRFTAMAV